MTRFGILDGPPLWGDRGLVFSLAVDNLPDCQKRPMIIDRRFRRWVSFNLLSQDDSRQPGFDAIINAMERHDVFDEIWRITGEGAFLPTLKDIIREGVVRTRVHSGPLTRFKAEYNIRTRKGTMEIFVLE